MAITDQALRFVQRLAWSSRRVPAPTRLLIVTTTLCTIAVAGCAQNTARQGLEANHTHPAAGARSHTRPRLRRLDVALAARKNAQPRPRLDPALLTPQPAPDCGFDLPDRKTVDEEQWANLKLDYERRCYQTAEMVVRERLARLQRAVDDMRR